MKTLSYNEKRFILETLQIKVSLDGDRVTIGVNPWDWTLWVRKVWQGHPSKGRTIMRDRKDLAMRNQRSFSLEFKRQAVEELLSGESRPAQLCRRYNITSSVLYHY